MNQTQKDQRSLDALCNFMDSVRQHPEYWESEEWLPHMQEYLDQKSPEQKAVIKECLIAILENLKEQRRKIRNGSM